MNSLSSICTNAQAHYGELIQGERGAYALLGEQKLDFFPEPWYQLYLKQKAARAAGKQVAATTSNSYVPGAGGNVGAVAAGFLFKSAIPWPTAFLILGALVTVCSFAAFAVRFNTEAEKEAKRQQAEAEHNRRSSSQQQPGQSVEPVLT